MTHDKTLEGLKACVLAAEGAEDLEYYVTLMRLQEEGVAVDTVALSMDSFAGKNGLKITPDLTIDEAAGIAYDVVVLPGGWAPDKLRRSEPVLELIRNRYEAGAVVAAICHGPWLLISAGLVQGRRATGSWVSRTTWRMPEPCGSTKALSSTVNSCGDELLPISRTSAARWWHACASTRNSVTALES